jgi:hypothetical protein
MDTVHRIVEDLHVIQAGNLLTGFNAVSMQQTGIGGDDKVGLFIALECLEQFDEIKVAFFRDEEIGCQGSYIANMDFFTDCSMVLQCDRQGNDDFVIDASGTELSGMEFQDSIQHIIDDFGYHYECGMMTDVMALKEMGLGVPCANMSCGYYRPHCADEYVNVKDVENCMNMVFQIFLEFGSVPFKHVARTKMYGRGAGKYATSTTSTKYGSLSGPYPPLNSSDQEWQDWANRKGKYARKMDEWTEEEESSDNLFPKKKLSLSDHYDDVEVVDEFDEVEECPNCGTPYSGYQRWEEDPKCEDCMLHLSEVHEFLGKD